MVRLTGKPDQPRFTVIRSGSWSARANGAAALMRPSIACANEQFDPPKQLANTPPPQSTTPGLYPVSIHQMAPPERTSHCSVLLICRPRKDERLSWPSVTKSWTERRADRHFCNKCGAYRRCTAEKFADNKWCLQLLCYCVNVGQKKVRNVSNAVSATAIATHWNSAMTHSVASLGGSGAGGMGRPPQVTPSRGWHSTKFIFCG